MSSLMKYAIALLVVLFNSCYFAAAGDSRTWTLDDFDDGDLKAASGLSWIVIADDLAGGATEARLELRPGGPETPRHALRLTGRLGGGSPSFAGAWISLERSGRNLDLSAFDGVRLHVKGPARLDVGFRSGTINFMAHVDAGPEWRLVDVPFATLAPSGTVPEGTRWNATTLQVFGVTTPQLAAGETRPAGDFSFEVHRVRRDPDEGGLGLRVLRDRLEALYHGGARMTAGPTANGGYRVVLSLPLTTGDDGARG